MLSNFDLRVGTTFKMDDDPWVVLETQFIKKAQSTGQMQAKIKNLRTGATVSRSFKQAGRFEEAELTKMPAQFIYSNRGKFVFAESDNPKNRFELSENQISDARFYLVPNIEVTALLFDDQIMNIELPVKVDLKVVEAPPSERGDTATSGKKTVLVETGLKINTPFFIKQGDVVRVNTKTGEYVERAALPHA
ncbi:MAG: hypothetical protein A2806_03345 [Candidatus Terrybacteria bacterium RIFCSPHIGHO2_01_FULL_48_17]|uniref:Elongation factor P C-terminal domain-containing protein n=1 Tax=Candidatus Terrybacteria bacterium RIFCSPHIGHO2_01_FULL_48_17 TaxID=1802362 RepID=A0A1G2PH56_9BACT|nr:MAG: hypothetical protein A2806_03345 [Candidatus Terrybacteria bacterium RIFCSPHIGHO2_01_FULL_48_17]